MGIGPGFSQPPAAGKPLAWARLGQGAIPWRRWGSDPLILQTSREQWSRHQETCWLCHSEQTSSLWALASSAIQWGGGMTEAMEPLPLWLQELQDPLSLITSTSMYVPDWGWVLWVLCSRGQMPTNHSTSQERPGCPGRELSHMRAPTTARCLQGRTQCLKGH